MESWEVLEKAIPRTQTSRVAQLLGVGVDYVRKWRREPESEESPTASGQRSILDRICNLIDAVFLVNPTGTGLIVNHVVAHHQKLLDLHAAPIDSSQQKDKSVSLLLRQAMEAIDRLNIEGASENTLRELVELRDAADSVIKQVEKTLQEVQN